MNYRREIDGLRALAVLPVILGHADYEFFKGGFVGVDVFFTISGYLITTIVMNELEAGNFSLLKFYERRARRILPALFLVIAATVPFCYLWMMPDEFKNFGQSIVATALFSNNILLALTSDYWSLQSSFKPLLHTWSLGVEEQYYMIFPVFLIFLYKYFKSYLSYTMSILLILSISMSILGLILFPAASFYVLPTRGWEILSGSLIAYWLQYRSSSFVHTNALIQEFASLAGLLMIALAVVLFDDSYPSPGPWILFPVGGAVLIIAFAVEGTIAHRILSSRGMVGIGLISYSLYLWHQPLFALARIRAKEPLDAYVYVELIVCTFLLAYLTWRFIEKPFRNRRKISTKTVVFASLTTSVFAISFGVYLDTTYGMYWRFFTNGEKISEIDKRIYNSRVYIYKNRNFLDQAKIHLLVIGNSFGRDFVNMTTETFDTSRIEFVYSDSAETCIDRNTDDVRISLFEKADVIVFANFDRSCVSNAINWTEQNKKRIFFIGTKDFGYNLNWLTQLPIQARANQYNKLPDFISTEEQMDANVVPAANFVSLLRPVVKNGMVPITDEKGRMISTDRRHVTKFGAIYFGEHVLKPTAFGELLLSFRDK